MALYGGDAGQPFDPCYHQLCDTLANISARRSTEHKDAAVHAIGTFAQTTSSVNGTSKASSTVDEGVGLEGRQAGPLTAQG